jgi:hypothetical protein
MVSFAMIPIHFALIISSSFLLDAAIAEASMAQGAGTAGSEAALAVGIDGIGELAIGSCGIYSGISSMSGIRTCSDLISHCFLA